MEGDTLTVVIQMFAAAAAALGAWGFLTVLGSRKEDPSDRLARMMAQTKGRAGGPAAPVKASSGEELQKRMAEITKKLGEQLKVGDEEVSQIKLDLLHAGFRSKNSVSVFQGLKLVSLLIATAVTVPVVLSKYGTSRDGLIYMVCGVGFGMYLPTIFLMFMKSRRQEAIFLTLPDALDLMVVSVEAGLGLDAAMRKISTELADSAPVLCEELAISNFQMQMGRPRKDVLRDLGMRTGVNDLRALAAVLIQAERFGSSIASALRVQSESMRVKRRQLAEERAAKTAVQLLFPLILFIFPGIFVVLVGPAAISIKQQLMK